MTPEEEQRIADLFQQALDANDLEDLNKTTGDLIEEAVQHMDDFFALTTDQDSEEFGLAVDAHDLMTRAYNKYQEEQDRVGEHG